MPHPSPLCVAKEGTKDLSLCPQLRPLNRHLSKVQLRPLNRPIPSVALYHPQNIFCNGSVYSRSLWVCLLPILQRG